MARKQILSLALSVVSLLTLSTAVSIAPSFAADPVASQESGIGRIAPDFTLTDVDGKKHTLSDYKNKYVVLEWINFGCPFVKKHYESKNMQKLQAQYTDKGVVWLSICSSAKGEQGNMAPEEIKKELKAKDWKGTAYLIDEDGAVGRKYGAKTTPDMFVIDKSGELVYAGAIDSKATPYQSDIAGAKNYLKAALDEIMSGSKVALAETKSYGCSVKYSKNQ